MKLIGVNQRRIMRLISSGKQNVLGCELPQGIWLPQAIDSSLLDIKLSAPEEEASRGRLRHET
jgi:hypothetical protein